MLIPSVSANDEDSPSSPVNESHLNIPWEDRELFERKIANLRTQNNWSKSEAAVLHALAWLTDFLSDDKTFSVIFSDAILMLHELSLNNSSSQIQTLSIEMLVSQVNRARLNLDKLYSFSVYDFWDFSSILGLIYQHQIPPKDFIDFYHKFDPETIPLEYSLDISDALANYNYDVLGDYLIDYSFLHHLAVDYPDTSATLPFNPYLYLLESLQNIPFIHTFESNQTEYSIQNYFVTHVALVLTNYGSKNIENGVFAQRIYRYLIDELATVRYQTNDLDLLAEFVHCLKFFGAADNQQVQEATDYLLSKQLENGAWGTPSELQSDPYVQMHPTWAISTALHYQLAR